MQTLGPVVDQDLEALDLEPVESPASEPLVDEPAAVDDQPLKNTALEGLQKNVEEYAASLFFEGESMEDIQEKLTQQGWPQNTQDKAMEFTKNIANLQQSVHQWRATGYHNDQIRAHLIELGWSAYIVHEVLK